MARIRRLVRAHPHDRELQRLLHALLTSISADRVDEAEVKAVLEQACKSAHATRMHTPRSMLCLRASGSSAHCSCRIQLRRAFDSGAAVQSPFLIRCGSLFMQMESRCQ
eukprot:2043007-Pleurochrysis_carterae.AAC.1